MRRHLIAAVAGLALAVPAVAAVPATAAPYCGITWGSTARSDAGTSVAPLTGVRGGRHDCYDRLVLDLAGPADGYSVRYVSQVTQDGSGAVVPLRGGARLQVTVHSPAYDVETGDPTYTPTRRTELVNVSGWRTFRQVAWAGSFEGYTTVGLGVRARLPFRVLRLDGPGNGSRLVVDVAHQW
jgi:hypothetical protein